MHNFKRFLNKHFSSYLLLLMVLPFIPACASSEKALPPRDAFSELVQMIDHPSDDLFPTVSRDGELVAYVSMKSKGESAIYFFDPNQKGKINMSQALSTPGGDSHPSWGIGRDLYFDSSRLKTLSIWKAQVDKGRGTTQITVRNADDFAPDVTIDGKLVFNSAEKKPTSLFPKAKEKMPTICVSDTDGSRITYIGNGWMPKWTPDGKKIVFVAPADNHLQIWIMNPDGSESTQLTSDSNDHIYPAVSPDMKTLVFSTKQKNNYDIWAMNLQGKGLTQLTFDPADDIAPAFAPNGMLFFSSKRGKTWDIWAGRPIIPW